MKRRTFTPKFKTKVALEMLTGKKTLAQICSEYGIHATQAKSWKKKAKETLEEGFTDGRTTKAIKDRDDQIEDLYTELGKLKYENEWIKKKHQQLGIE